MKILATDYDNTLKRKRVSKQDLESIARFRKEGNLFGIVTGRSIDMIKPSLRLFKVKYDFIVGINGGIILNDRDEILAHRLIDYDTALSIIADLSRFHCDFYGCCDGIRYTDLGFKNNAKNCLRALVFGLNATDKQTILNDKKIASFFTLSDDHRLVKEIYKHFSEKYDNISVFLNGKDVVDISGKDVSKANAVAVLADHFKADHVYTIGDSMNDYDMIKRFNGFAVKTAEDQIKEAATEVFDDFSQLIAYIAQDESDLHKWNIK